MARILVKRSATAGAVPTAGNLVTGELAINTADLKLYSKSNTNSIKCIAAPFGDDLPSIAGGRLTVTSNVPITTTDATNSYIYYTPYTSDKISLYDVTEARWIMRSFTNIYVYIGAATPGSTYDIFAYWNGSNVVIEAIAWTNDTTRLYAINRQNGVYIKTSDGHKYLGTIRQDSSGIQDKEQYRHVFNYYNRVQRLLTVRGSNTNWVYSSTAWRLINNDSTKCIKIVSGLGDTVVNLAASLLPAPQLANLSGHVGIGYNGVSPIGPVGRLANQTQYAQFNIIASAIHIPGVGYSTYNWIESGDTNGILFFDGSYGTVVAASMAGDAII